MELQLALGCINQALLLSLQADSPCVLLWYMAL